MDPAPQPFVTLADLMAKVGAFMFYWSSLEQALTEAITATRDRLGRPHSNVGGGLGERLDLWFALLSDLPENLDKIGIARNVRHQALALRKVRNLIVHGLQAGSSMSESGPAFIRCAVGGYEDPTGETVLYTIDQLEHFTQGIDACRRAFRCLDNFNYRIDLTNCP